MSAAVQSIVLYTVLGGVLFLAIWLSGRRDRHEAGHRGDNKPPRLPLKGGGRDAKA